MLYHPISLAAKSASLLLDHVIIFVFLRLGPTTGNRGLCACVQVLLDHRILDDLVAASALDVFYVFVANLSVTIQVPDANRLITNRTLDLPVMAVSLVMLLQLNVRDEYAAFNVQAH